MHSADCMNTALVAATSCLHPLRAECMCVTDCSWPLMQTALQAMPEKRVLIVNHENITRCRYTGEDRSMLVCNSLFRIGGAAVIMSNK